MRASMGDWPGDRCDHREVRAWAQGSEIACHEYHALAPAVLPPERLPRHRDHPVVLPTSTLGMAGSNRNPRLHDLLPRPQLARDLGLTLPSEFQQRLLDHEIK